MSNEENSEKEYEIEKILKRKIKNGESFYYIKWKNFDDSFNSWEPEINLEHSKKALNLFLKSQKLKKRKKKESKDKNKKKIKKKFEKHKLSKKNKSYKDITNSFCIKLNTKEEKKNLNENYEKIKYNKIIDYYTENEPNKEIIKVLEKYIPKIKYETKIKKEETIENNYKEKNLNIDNNKINNKIIIQNDYRIENNSISFNKIYLNKKHKKIENNRVINNTEIKKHQIITNDIINNNISINQLNENYQISNNDYGDDYFLFEGIVFPELKKDQRVKKILSITEINGIKMANIIFRENIFKKEEKRLIKLDILKRINPIMLFNFYENQINLNSKNNNEIQQNNEEENNINHIKFYNPFIDSD